MIYGTAIISGCLLAGNFAGLLLGSFLGVGINVGGVGFSMICLLCVTNWLQRQNRLHPNVKTGINFWKGMYIPVVVAMSASQNVVSALSQGVVAIAAGIAAVFSVILFVQWLSKRGLLT